MFMLVLLSHFKLQKLQPQCMISSDRKGITFVGGRHVRKHVPVDGNMLCQKASSLYEDIRKGSPESSDSKSFTAS